MGRRTLLGGSLAGGVLAACGSPAPVPTPASQPVSVTVSGIAPLAGAISRLTAVAAFTSGPVKDVSDLAVWESSDPSVIRVDRGGFVTGLAAGSADVRATYEDVAGVRRLAVIEGLSAFGRDYIESIHLGFGVLTPSDGGFGCPARGSWSGFPRGTTVRLVISDTVAPAPRNAILVALDDLAEATRDSLSVTVDSTSDPNPLPGVQDVTVTTHPSPSSQGCASDVGCTFPGFAPGQRGVLVGSRIVLPPTQTVNAYVHDAVGHGLMGMCHVDGAAIGGPAHSLMSFGPGVFSNHIAFRLTSLDIANARFVYDTILNPGATRQAFIDAGLISGAQLAFERPRPPALDRAAAPIPSLPMGGG